MSESAKKLLSFIAASPSRYHACAKLKSRLLAEGYTLLPEQAEWDIRPGGRYVVIRNDSSLLAFRVPAADVTGFTLAAAHADSPTFQIKEHAEKLSARCTVLDTERYGGMLMNPWFDRPLSVAGRIVVEQDGQLETRLVNLDRDLMIIPSVAIHMNRAANDGVKVQANVDTFPLLGCGSPDLRVIVAESVGVRPEQILGHDLFLYLRERGTVLGARQELLAAPQLDDLECAFALTEGFLRAAPSRAIPVLAVFDNEEVGSETKQGAASSFLRDTLRRLTAALGLSEQAYLRLLAGSFMVSADNAHAQHPNHPEFADGQNTPYLNGGITIKFNANQRYTTDAVSAAAFRLLCQETGVAVQVYSNRSDLPGGSTLGSISNTRVAVPTVDIGLPQLAMHSSFETAGVQDLEDLVRVMTAYYGKTPTVRSGAVQLV